MINEQLTIPLFPLSAHLLPGGRMALRIFEPRYVRMVKEACAGQRGFGICMLDSKGNRELNQHIYPVGTYATVVDFDLLEDGLLGVTIEGQHCFTIQSIHTQSDGLRVAECQWLEPWASVGSECRLQAIDERLREVFEKYPEVNKMYEKPRFDDPIWVIYRWLELLPVNAEQKQQFLRDKDYSSVLKFLSQLIE